MVQTIFLKQRCQLLKGQQGDLNNVHTNLIDTQDNSTSQQADSPLKGGGKALEVKKVFNWDFRAKKAEVGNLRAELHKPPGLSGSHSTA